MFRGSLIKNHCYTHTQKKNINVFQNWDKYFKLLKIEKILKNKCYTYNYQTLRFLVTDISDEAFFSHKLFMIK